MNASWRRPYRWPYQLSKWEDWGPDPSLLLQVKKLCKLERCALGQAVKLWGVGPWKQGWGRGEKAGKGRD